MSKEQSIIGADAGCGRKDKYILPFNIEFPYTDSKGCELFESVSTNDISDKDFYIRMENLMEENIVPKTSGVVTEVEIMKSDFGEVVRNKEKKSIVFISTTSKHSNAFNTATKSWQDIAEGNSNIKAKVIDSQQVSEGIGFLIDLGKELIGKGATSEQINNEIENTIPRIVTFISLESFRNIIAGGRLGNIPPAVANWINSAIKFRPLLQMREGKLHLILERPRTMQIAWNRILERVGEISSYEKIAVVHANYEEKAKELADSLGKINIGNVTVAKVDLAVAVHAGKGAIAFFGLKKK
jgi:DegV family protein with EDD domain